MASEGRTSEKPRASRRCDKRVRAMAAEIEVGTLGGTKTRLDRAPGQRNRPMGRAYGPGAWLYRGRRQTEGPKGRGRNLVAPPGQRIPGAVGACPREQRELRTLKGKGLNSRENFGGGAIIESWEGRIWNPGERQV